MLLLSKMSAARRASVGAVRHVDAGARRGMGTISGRAWIDWLRHRVGFAMGGRYQTTPLFWERAYERSGGLRHIEWAGVGFGQLEEYAYRDAYTFVPGQPQTPDKGKTLRKTSRWEDDVPKTTNRVLIVGSGTSTLGVDMAARGWRGSITHVDFAPAVIVPDDQAPDRCKWVLGDARELKSVFDDDDDAAFFDVVIDKGTLDSIYLSNNEGHAQDLAQIVDGVSACLAPTGPFLAFSLTKPEYLLPLLLTVDTAHNWDAARSEVRRLNAIYLYVLRRKNAAYRAPPRPAAANATSSSSSSSSSQPPSPPSRRRR